MSRFEDAYYEFQSIDFDGFDISVQNFIPYAIPDKKLLFLLINPKFKANIGRKQYCVIVDTERLNAFECTGIEENFDKIFFFSDSDFLAQTKIA